MNLIVKNVKDRLIKSLFLSMLIIVAACSPVTTPEVPVDVVPATNTSEPSEVVPIMTSIPTDEPTEVPTLAPTVPTEGELPQSLGAVKGIILFIGDGMGNAQRTAGRWVTVGQNGIMAMDRMQVSGWMSTAAYQNPVTDSAAAATAMATGYITRNGRIGVDADEVAVPTILEQAKQRGWATGLVTTTPISHATPAGFAAHTTSRNNYELIASQMLNLEVDVMLGGGEEIWLPSGTPGCNPGNGTRDDGRNLVEEAIGAGYTFVCSPAELAAVDTSNVSRLLGLFARDGLVRPHSPSLADMTRIAIEILSRDEDGFFLMVEGGQIDWAGHDNDPEDMLESVA
ncbi:MAG: alkaline phosphatase, partial [Chloroflexota bacterium]